MTHRFLKLLTYNVRSLVDTSRRVELVNTMFYNSTDIGFIQECHLNKNFRINLKGYNFIYDNSRIGVAVMIKYSVKYNRVNIGDVHFFGSFISV